MYKVGIDLGGTNIKAGIVDEKYNILKQASVPTCAERTHNEIIKDMTMLVKELMEQMGIEETELEGIGIGSPGMIDAKEGIVVYSNNIRWDARQAAKKHPESMLNQLCGNDLSNMNGKIPFDAAQANDAAAKEVVDRYIMYLGESIANFVNIFRPNIVLLSGGVCNQGEKLTEPLNQYIKDKCFGGEKSFIPKIRCATLGNNAGIIGAASLI